MVVSEERMAALEARTARLEARMTRLDARRGGRRPRRAAPSPRRRRAASRPRGAAPARRGPPRRAPRRRRAPVAAPPARPPPAPRLEDLLGGRVLGWVGGLAVLVGLLFLLVIAASRGWIGEEARVLMAGAASLALLAAGVRLHERRGRTEAALVAAATGIAGLFASAVVAGPVYGLVPALLALAARARRRAPPRRRSRCAGRRRGSAGSGILGALASPALVGAAGDGTGIALMLVAYAAAGAVLLWQRWHALAFAAFARRRARSSPWWLVDAGRRRSRVARRARRVRRRHRRGRRRLRVARAQRGAARLRRRPARAQRARPRRARRRSGSATPRAHLRGSPRSPPPTSPPASLARRPPRARRRPRASAASSGSSLVTLGVVLADVAFAAVADGLPLVAGWAAGARRLLRAGPDRTPRRGRGRRAGRARRPPAARRRHRAHGRRAARRRVGRRAATRPPRSPRWPRSPPRAWAAARLVAPRRPEARIALDAIALAARRAARRPSLLAGVALTLALRRRGGRAGGARPAPAATRSPLPAAVAFLAAALGHALALLAPPEALVARPRRRAPRASPASAPSPWPPRCVARAAPARSARARRSPARRR